jgi:hypothetical protein
MTPADGSRVWRKTARRAWRGQPAGRRTTHAVRTTYGRRQRRRDWLAMWDAAQATPEAVLMTVPAQTEDQETR